MLEKIPDKYRKTGWEVFKVAAAICVLVFLLMNFSMVKDAVAKVFSVLTPIWIGVLLFLLVHPLYSFLMQKFETHKTGGRLSKLSATCISLLAVCLVLGLFVIVFKQIYDSVVSLIQQAPEYFEKLGVVIEGATEKYPEWKDKIENAYSSLIGLLQNFVNTTVIPNLSTIAASLFTSVKSAAIQLLNILVGLISMVYLLNANDKILPWFKKLIYAFLKKETADTFCSDMKSFTTIFGKYILGKILDSLIVGILCFIFMSLMKMQYSVLVSVIICVTNIIPFFGPFIGAIPTGLLLLLINPQHGVVFLIFIVVLQQIDGNIIGPRILGKSTGVTSFWILFSVLLFGGLFGVVGMILAIPLWAVLTGLLNRCAAKRLQMKGLPVADSAYALGKDIEVLNDTENVSNQGSDEDVEQ